MIRARLAISALRAAVERSAPLRRNITSWSESAGVAMRRPSHALLQRRPHSLTLGSDSSTAHTLFRI